MKNKALKILKDEGLKGLMKRLAGRIKRQALLSELGRIKKFGRLTFRCNICGRPCEVMISELKREEPSCLWCGSSVRMRSIIHVLSMELFGRSLAIQDFPQRPDITGIGMSDWDDYAVPLAGKLNYKNTFYHKEPRLDITAIDPSLEGTMDFVISTDVFEHIEPPVRRAFENSLRLLKPNGVLVFSVPYQKEGKTLEHFPELYKYEIIKKDSGFMLKNTTRNDREQFFSNLVFHGGPGSTLEMRLFSEASLLEEFRNSGFNNVKIHKNACFEHGIYWAEDWSLPMAARKTCFNLA